MIRILSFLLLFSVTAHAQDDLLSLLDEETKPKGKEDVTATFKTTRVVTGQSIEMNHGGVLNFVIQHRFGTINSGAYELFGLDQASIKLNLELGITNRLNTGISRSSIGKYYEGYLKYKIAKQKINGFPLSIVAYSSMGVDSRTWPDPERKNYFSSRLYYTHQLLVASRITPGTSVQVMPTMVHRNLVPAEADKNDVFIVGIGGRQKLNKRVAINAEYYYVLPNQIVTNSSSLHNSFSLGFDIETGGHVFQLHMTNSRQMSDKGFLTETDGSWGKGDIIFGFNISRVFNVYQWKKNW